MGFSKTREITPVLLTIKKKILPCIQTFMNLLMQTCYDDRYYCIQRFSTSLTDLDSKSQECKKPKNSVPVISQTFQSISTFDILLRLVDVMRLMLIYLVIFVLKGENPTFVISLKTKKQNKTKKKIKNTPPPPQKKTHWLVFRHLQTNFFSKLV